MHILKHHGNGEVSLNFHKEILFQEKFSCAKEALTEGIKKTLELKITVIHFHNFSEKINNKIDAYYGKSMTNKFKYAHISQEDFIKETLIKLKETHLKFHDKMILLLSPIQKIYHDTAVNIQLRSDDYVSQEVKINSFVFKSNDFVKPKVSFFTDASVTKQTFLAGIGVSKEEVVVSFRKEIKSKNNNIAEIEAIYHAIKLGQQMQLAHLEIFTDSLPAINLLHSFSKNGKIKEEFENLIRELQAELNQFETYQIAWIPRNKNKLADKMSKVDFLFNHTC